MYDKLFWPFAAVLLVTAAIYATINGDPTTLMWIGLTAFWMFETFEAKSRIKFLTKQLNIRIHKEPKC